MTRLSQFADCPQLFTRKAMSRSQEGAAWIMGGFVIGLALGGLLVAALYLVGAQ